MFVKGSLTLYQFAKEQYLVSPYVFLSWCIVLDRHVLLLCKFPTPLEKSWLCHTSSAILK